MASEHIERKLAAIVAADVAGYSQLMAADEEGTLALLKAHRKALIDPKIAEHRGRIVKTTGDGILIEFASVVDAVRCLVEIQRGMLERNADIPTEKRIDFRVGINVGDVIVDGDDIYGDGVNVAARLESLAEPGGILVSGMVREQVRDKLSVTFDDVGDRRVKNIPRAVRTYRVKLSDDGRPTLTTKVPADRGSADQFVGVLGMTDEGGVAITAGQTQGIIGARRAHVSTLNINNYYYRSNEEPGAAAEGDEQIPRCPYPGLAYFLPNEADLFFGRDASIDRLADAVGRRSLTALVGASGSGKSSVVLAGLAPRLDGMGGWLFSHFRIGNELEHDPFLALARALVPFFVTSKDDVERLVTTKKLASKLQSGDLTLREVFSDCRSLNKGSRILLIADQFEEIFTLIDDVNVRHRFIDVLLAGFSDSGLAATPDISLILTLRADFYGRALLHRPFADALQGHIENLGPMNREELRAAIQHPAENAKVSFESGLVETLLDDVENKPGSLPLLEFALREMWARQENRKITRQNYDAIGGVQGAVAQRAEAIFAKLTANGADRQTAKAFERLFTRLITLGEGQEDTRRVVERQELGDSAWALAQHLAGEGNRLVVTNAPAVSRETAEVVHEALIRHWPRLIGWINRDRIFQSWLRQIKPNVENWSADKADEGPLLRGSMLAQATEWLARRRDDLSPSELAFIEASVRRSRHASQLRGYAAAIFLMFFLATSFLTVGLIGALSEADERSQAAIAAAGDAAHQTVRAQASIAKIENDNARYFEAATAALAGLRAFPTSEPDQMACWVELIRAGKDGFLVPPLRHQDSVLSASFDPKGERVVTASADHTARIWDAHTGELIGKPLQHQGKVFSATFDSNGELIVTASEDNTARVWDARTGEPIGKPLRHGGPVASAAFDPTGNRVVTASFDHTARIWDAHTSEPIGEPLQHQGSVSSATFDPIGERIVTASADHTAIIWNAGTGERIYLMEDIRPVVSAAFDPTGERVVTTSEDGQARIWNPRTSARQLRLQSGGPVTSAAFDPTGARVVTTSVVSATTNWGITQPRVVTEIYAARVWDAHTGEAIGKPMQHQGGIISASFDATGERVVTASFDHTARVWNARSGDPIGDPLRHQSQVSSAKFDSSGERVVTASEDETARIWDVRSNEPIGRPLQHKDQVWSAEFDPTSERVVTASFDHTASVWDARIGEPIGNPLQHQGQVSSAKFDSTGERVVTASDDNTARVWDARTGASIGKPLQHLDRVISAVFDPTGERVVTASFDHTARVWNARTGEPIGNPLQHQGQVLSAKFDSSGGRVVTASEDNTARVWDARTSEPIGKPLQHQASVMSASFDSTGERIVTASFDNTARVWDVHTSEPIGKPLQHQGLVVFAAFDLKGERVVTASFDHTARIWDARTGEPIGKPLQHQDNVWSAVFDVTGERVVTASADHTARIWDARTGEPIGKPLQHQDKVWSAMFDATGERVVTASADKTAGIWKAPPSGEIYLNQVRVTLGRNAPPPFHFPPTTEQNEGWWDYVNTIPRGLQILWRGARAKLTSP